MRKHYRWIFQLTPKQCPHTVSIIRVLVTDVDGALCTCVPVNDDGSYMPEVPFVTKKEYLFKSPKRAKEYLSHLVRNALFYFAQLEASGWNPNCNLHYLDGFSSTYKLLKHPKEEEGKNGL